MIRNQVSSNCSSTTPIFAPQAGDLSAANVSDQSDYSFVDDDSLILLDTAMHTASVVLAEAKKEGGDQNSWLHDSVVGDLLKKVMQNSGMRCFVEDKYV